MASPSSVSGVVLSPWWSVRPVTFPASTWKMILSPGISSARKVTGSIGARVRVPPLGVVAVSLPSLRRPSALKSAPS